MKITDKIKREIMREMGSKGGKSNTRAHLVRASKLGVEARRQKKLSTGGSLQPSA